jgi:hypothetical protein
MKSLASVHRQFMRGVFHTHKARVSDAALNTVISLISLLPASCSPIVRGWDSPLQLTDAELTDFYRGMCSCDIWSKHLKNYVN